MRSADTVDILISFIKWSGLRLLMPAFEDLATRNAPVRVITTSYMGASDSPAVEWLAKMPNIEVRVSYDTDRTRLHAKAYHFQRNSGFSTAYIGSAITFFLSILITFQPFARQYTIQHARTKTPLPTAFPDLRLHPFQKRILDALEAERTVHNQLKALPMLMRHIEVSLYLLFLLAHIFLIKPILQFPNNIICKTSVKPLSQVHVPVYLQGL